MSTSFWQIWIDTGGTFTDCIAISPSKERKRVKVLSSSRLRGRMLHQISDSTYQITHKWPVSRDVFEGYECQIGTQKANVKRINLQEGILYLDQNIDLQEAIDFELTAHEEAPILATRLITATKLNEPFPTIQLKLGSTKGTNALLERKGVKTALLITKGFKDLLKIGTQQRPHLFQLNIPQREQLYDIVIEIDERIAADGTILKKLDKTQISKIIQQLHHNNIQSIAIAFLNAYKNPKHEEELTNFLKEEGFLHISTSSNLFPAIQLLTRAQTAVVNAYLNPIISNYLQQIQSKLSPESTLKVMTSAGGLVDASLFQAKDSLLSGPAGGVVGAVRIAQSLGYNKIIGLDMGGTSTDTAIFDEQFSYQYQTKVGGAVLASPSLAIATVAAGGGSICYFDGTKLNVGPESAGAQPGPACYGAGGPLTITDVNLLLGKFVPDQMGIPIDKNAAEKALKKLQDEIYTSTKQPISTQELLKGLEQIANEKMADAIRTISIEKGIDPSEYTLVAFGGAGGLHACKVAEMLQMKKIILPYEGGLLSAYGIGNAVLERIKTRQIIQPLEECLTEISNWIDELSLDAIEALQEEKIAANTIQIRAVFCYLRTKGQSNTLEIPFQNIATLATQYETQYQQLFGYWMKDSTIELESIKVIASTTSNLEKDELSSLKSKNQSTQNSSSLINWDHLQSGDSFTGTAILMNAYATNFIDKNWTAQVSHNKTIVLTHHPVKEEQKEIKQDAIALELFTNRFFAIANEMGAQLQRTAISVNIKERLDFSCAILDANAELLVNAPHIPVHLGSLGICTRLVLEELSIEKGDVIITNHPKFGGSHLPDITLISGVFTDSNDLIAYVINRAHHAEIGSKRPGSMPPDATALIEEGVVIAPTYLIKKGIPQWDKITHLMTNAPYPTRALAENIADLKAALAALETGKQALIRLANRYSLPTVHYYMKQIKQLATDALAKQLSSFQNKTFSAIEALDDGHEIHVQIEVGDKMKIDFSGTSSVHPNNLNANISIVYSAVLYVLRLLCDEAIPLNEGLLQNIEIILPKNSFLHPDFKENDEENPAVVGGNTEVSQRLTDTLLKALKMAACSQGTMNNFLFGNEKFGYYETIGGGVGAGDGFKGHSAIHQHMTNTKITDPEELELHYPVRLKEFSIRANSGGNGKWNGGDGIIREMGFLEDVDFTLISQHRKIPPYGIDGGQNGKCGQQMIIRKNGKQELIEGIIAKRLHAGDRVRIETPGGGAWGEA